jgi:hypothetical protein
VSVRDQVRELAAQGLAPRAITRRVFGRESKLYYASLGGFSAINFTRKFLNVY